MSITYDEFKDKVNLGGDPGCNNARQVLTDASVGLDYDDPAALLLWDMQTSLQMLSNPDAYEETHQESLNKLAGVRDRLRGKDIYQTIKNQYKGKPDAEIGKFYDALHQVDQLYGLDLQIGELDPEYTKHIEKREKAEEKQKQQEQKARQKAQAAERSWENYAKLHRPKEGKNYSDNQKRELIAKRMVASYIHVLNQQNPDKPIPFDVSDARKAAKQLASTTAFKNLTKDPDHLDGILGWEPDQLAEQTESLRRPFKNMTVDERKSQLKMLKESVLAHMDPPEGRSEKYRKMYASIQNADPETLTDCDDPAKNGENLLQGVLDSTIAYQKGKKSLRSKPDQQCRFDQSVDILCTLSMGHGVDQHTIDGQIARINEVRRGHGQPEVSHSSYGPGDARFHSNARRLQMEEERRQREAAKEAPKVPEEKKAPAKEEKTAPAAEKKAPAPAKKRTLDQLGYTGVDQLENSDLKYDDVAVGKLPLYAGEPGNFTKYTNSYSYVYQWNNLKNTNASGELLKKTVAASLAAKESHLYRNEENDLGMESQEFERNYQARLKDPVVGKMADMLGSPDSRKALFKDESLDIHQMDFNKLQDKYNEAEKTMNAPVMGL